MKEENKFFLVLFLAIIVLSFLIVKTLICSLLAAAVLAYVAYPAYSWLKNKLRSESIAAFITTAALMLIIILPAILLLKELIGELFQIYFGIRNVVAALEISSCSSNSLICSIASLYNTFLSDPQLKLPLTNAVSNVAARMIDTISNSLIGLPKKLLDLFVIIFSTYYLFKEGDRIIAKLEAITPLKKKHKEDLFSRIESSIKGTVYGSLLIALLQGAIAMAGFYIFSVDRPITLGILTVFAAVLPFIGAAVVWLPASLIMILNALMQQNNVLLFRGAALFIYGALIISSIDNLLKPKIIGDRAKIHPLIVLLGVIGGIKLFGIVGFLIGPALLAVFVAFIDIYSEERLLE